MLPKLVYELLPFMYLTVGVGSAVVISSTIIFVASLILIVAGILVLSMRISYRREIKRMRQSHI